MKIEIKDTKVNEKSGTSAKTNKPYTIREQAGYAHLPNSAYPVEISITLDKDAPAWSPGMYLVDDASFYADRFKRLTIGRLELRPIAATQAKAS